MIVGLIGRRRAGKDTAAAALAKDGFFQVKFADGLKIMLRALLKSLDFSDRTVESMIEGDLKEEPISTLGNRSPRYLMQTLGTQWGRDVVSEDLWVKIAIERCQQFPNAVISDCRHPNEAEAVRRAGGMLIRIKRNTGLQDSHSSETLVDHLPYDVELVNDGSIELLQANVRLAVREFQR